MADLVVYGTPASPFVRKVMVALAHAGADYEFENVNIMAMPDWFVEISPAKRIPVLRDKTVGETGVAGTIPDSSAICLFLEKRLNAGLYGADAFEAGRVAWMEEYADTVMALPTGMDFFRPLIFPLFTGKAADVDTARKTWNEKFPPLFDYLEGVLDGGDYFVGNQFSLADIAVGCQMTQIDLVAGLPDAGKWPSLVKHTEAMKARPGFKENLETCTKMFSAILPEKIDLN
ncbi:MAG: glutathione S-transferase family protein [Pseudomonadota bacterium]